MTARPAFHRLLSPAAAALGLALLLGTPAAAVEEGDAAADFVLTDLLTGEPFSMSQFRGQVVCINFWAYW